MDLSDVVQWEILRKIITHMDLAIFSHHGTVYKDPKAGGILGDMPPRDATFCPGENYGGC